MSDKLHFSLNLIFATISFAMAVCFLALPSPTKKELRNYRISKRVLAAAFFMMSVLTVLILVFDISDGSRELLAFSTIFISATQAILFTFTLLTLFDPYLLSIRNILWRIMLLLLVLVVYIISYWLFGDPVILSSRDIYQNILHPTFLLRLFFVLYYCVQLIIYTGLFFKEERRFANEINNYFSETVQLRLSWVRYAFLAALFIAILSLLSNFFGSIVFDTIFTSFYTLFYFVFAIEYLRYTNIFNIIEPAINTTELPIIQNTELNNKWDCLKNKVFVEKFYLKEGVTIDEMAHWLNIGRTTLSTYINQEEKVNFSTWINVLRIEEAKRIMLENKDLTIMNIAQLTGYSEQANFSRQFKICTGVSPSVWMKGR